jgi:outer membrane biogenesis lipoprotein LolB
MIANNKPVNSALLIICVILFSGCTHLLPPPQDDVVARRVLERLVGNNIGLTHYKALAHIRMESDDGVRSGRVAMAAVVPHKLRADWLNMMGQPVTSLAGDGQTISIWSAADHKVHRLDQSPKALAKLIQIPIGIEDFQNIVIGRPSLPTDTAVQFKETRNDADIFTLKNRWHEEIATIRVDRSTGRILAMRTFDGHGRLQYETHWLQWRRQGKYLLPVKMTFESRTKQRLSLSVERFWPDADVPASVFELNPPES